MKTLLFVISIFCLSQAAFAQCAGAPGAYHTNPDSSPGGFVASTAYVAPEVILSPNSQVCDSASVEGQALVINSSIIRNFASITSNPPPGNVIINGSVIENQAVVADSAKVIFATVKGLASVRGGSLVQGDVADLTLAPVIAGQAKLQDNVQVKNRGIVNGNALL